MDRLHKLITEFLRERAQIENENREARRRAAARRNFREEMRREWWTMRASSKIKRLVYKGCRQLSESDLLSHHTCLICYEDFQVGENVPRIPHPCLENNSMIIYLCLKIKNNYCYCVILYATFSEMLPIFCLHRFHAPNLCGEMVHSYGGYRNGKTSMSNL